MEEEELPEGVLSINDAALGSVEAWKRLDVVDLVMMWKSKLSPTLQLPYQYV